MTIGRIVGGKYCLLYEIGGGAMGSVWAAQHIHLKTRVALKLIKPSFAGSSEAVRRFEKEARAAASLSSRYVVQVRDYGVDAGNPYLVMELLDGESLAARLERGPLPAAEVATVINHTAKALTKVHAAGLVHRDLKPHNLFLTSDDGGLLVKVLDFGVTKTLADSSSTALTRTGLLVGTLHYMSPEQADSQPVDARSDVWSLGVIAFECLTGRVPFDDTTIEGLLDAICTSDIVVPSTLARVPLGFDDWFKRAVERERKLRFQSARELADALAPLLASDPSTWVGEWSADTLPNPEHSTLHLHTYPSGGPDRRGELRRPSMIPAGIDRRRDLRHTALIYNWSRTGALLLTRHPCQLEQQLVLTLHVDSPDHGETVTASVVRISRRADPIWTLEVGVRFETPLPEELLRRLEHRSSGDPGLAT